MGTLIVLAIVVVVAAVIWFVLLRRLYGGQGAQVQLDVIRTAGTLVIGTGGAMALLLTARRQRYTEVALVHTDRDAPSVVGQPTAACPHHLGGPSLPAANQVAVRAGGTLAPWIGRRPCDCSPRSWLVSPRLPGAACWGRCELFDPIRGNSPRFQRQKQLRLAEGARVCAGCPVTQRCLDVTVEAVIPRVD